MNQNNDQDFRQFKGAFDDAMLPDDAFKAKMERLLQAEVPAVQATRSTVLASPSKQSGSAPIPGRQSHPLMVAAAVLTVFAVVAASMWVLSGSVLEGEYASAPSGIPTMPADAPGTPGPDVLLTSEVAIARDTSNGSGGYTLAVIDGVIYTIDQGPATESNYDESTTFLSAWNSDTGEKLWEIEGYSIWNISVSDGVLVGTRSSNQSGNNLEPDFAYSLVGLDSETGELRWEEPIGTDDLVPSLEEQVTVSGDLALFITPESTLRALDIGTGEILWESEFDRGPAWPTTYSQGDETFDVDLYAVSVTANESYIAVANGDGLVQIFDPVTGVMETSYELDLTDSSYGFGPGALTVASHPEGLLIQTRGEDDMLTLIDSATGEIKWQRSLPGSLQIVVAENGTIAVNSHVWESGSIIMRFFGRGGHPTNQFFWIDGRTGDDILATERGAYDVPVYAISDGMYLCVRNNELVCYDQFGTRHVVDAKPQSEIFLENGALYFDEADGVHRVVLP